MMDPQRWRVLSTLIDEAWALEGAARQAYLEGLDEREPGLAPRVREALAGEETLAADSREIARRTRFDQLLAPAMERLTGVGRPPDRLDGVRLGPWKLDALIGEGGMGQVWRAHRADGLYEGEAAIKLLRSDLGQTALAARFARERALLGRLEHPGIARLLDAGIAAGDAGPVAGQAYLVLELAQGLPLQQWARQKAPTLARRVRLLLRVAEAVEYAHARLVVHRDLKPANVVVSDRGRPKLLDFGIAALLDDDSGGELTRLVGCGLTPAYAAPEQIAGGPIGTAADVFSLGVMLYELCCGVLPSGPRQGSRTAIEHAVLHAEPLRLATVLADEISEDAVGPGRPGDAALARGDLEAIALKALRKDPAARYGSVRPFIDDLRAWLEHRPVSARRDNWRHNTRLWLRRHAVLASATLLVVTALVAGLGTSLWQRQRADAAARDSAEVTSYLTDLLASASPDRHGGNWPTVLQLLESSRAELPQRFADSPDTRLRVMQVLVETYRRLGRLDITIPLGRELVEQARQRWGGADRRTLMAVYELVLAWQLQGQCDLAWPLLEPALPDLRALRPTEADDPLKVSVLGQATICALRTGRNAEADDLLAELQALVAGVPASDHRSAIVHTIQSAVHSERGRMAEALEAARATQPFWSSPRREHQRDILLYQRNLLALQVRMAEYDRIDERSAQLLQRIEQFYGAGSNMALMHRHELGRYLLEVGRYREAAAQREDDLAYLKRLGIVRADLLLPRRAQWLLARAQSQAAAPEELRAAALDLLADTERARNELGLQRAEIWLALARMALSIDDAALAARTLGLLEADTALNLAPGPRQNQNLSRRKASLDAALARLRGDLGASRALQLARVAQRARVAPQPQVPAWSAMLDLACTLVLMGDPQATQALSDAASLRPASVPPGHPLDAAAAYLQIRLAAGRDDAPAARQAQRAMARAQQALPPGVEPARFPGPLRGNLGGVLF